MDIQKELLKAYVKNKKLLVRIIRKFVYQDADIEDLLQQTYCKALAANYTNISPEKLPLLLVTIARNEAISFVRKNKVHQNIENFVNDAKLSTCIDESNLVFEAVVSFIILAPTSIQKALKSHIIDEVPLVQAAKNYGTTRSELRYWKTKIFKDLKKYIFF